MNKYRVQIFPELSHFQTVGAGMKSRDFPDEKAAEAYRQSLINDNEAKDCNIRIVKIDADGVTVPIASRPREL
jgi:hypothetical protein